MTYGKEEASSEDARSAKGVFHISSTVGALMPARKLSTKSSKYTNLTKRIRMDDDIDQYNHYGNMDDKHDFENHDAESNRILSYPSIF